VNPDLSSFLVGGAASRPDSISGMQPALVQRLQMMLTTAPPEIQAALRIQSGYRSPETQAALYQAALGKYGSPEVARRWVAPPGHSEHNMGNAADLAFGSPAALKWAHDNAGQFGLAFPLSNENWHIEVAGARGGHPADVQMASAAPAQAAPTPTGPIAALYTQDASQAAMPPAVAAGLQAPPTAAPALLAANTSPLAGLADFFVNQQASTAQAQADEDARQARRRALIADAPDPFTRAVMI
jgi:hypothetical protein